jgi:hypothetical protein
MTQFFPMRTTDQSRRHEPPLGDGCASHTNVAGERVAQRQKIAATAAPDDQMSTSVTESASTSKHSEAIGTVKSP